MKKALCAALALLMTDIEDEVRHSCLRICKTQESDAVGSRHLGIDVIVFEQDLIITCRSILVVVNKRGTIAPWTCAVGIAWNREQLTCGWSNSDAADLELMGADKALDRRVTIVITCSLPTIGIAQRTIGRRTGLRHSERHGARCKMKSAAMRGTDTRFYVADERLCLQN